MEENVRWSVQQKALRQEWLDMRLEGLVPEDFKNETRFFCTSDLRPPACFESIWVNISESPVDMSRPLLTAQKAEDLQSIVVFCNQLDEQETDRLISIIANMESHGLDVPPILLVLHSFAPEHRPARDSDLLSAEKARFMLERGLDAIVSGEPRGLRLALAVNAEMQKCQKLSTCIRDMIEQQRKDAEEAEHLQQCMDSIIWDFVRARVAPDIPPIDESLLAGEPREIAGFDVGDRLGQGAFGSVWLLHDQLDRGSPPQVVKVAAKSKLSSIRDVKYFNRTIAVMKALSTHQCWHPNIVCLHETFHSSTHILLRMEYAGSENLFRRLLHRDPQGAKPARPLTAEKAMAVIAQTADAIAHMHNIARVCHRDVKPENIIVDDQPDKLIAKLTDFDLAMMCRNGSFTCLSACGTLPFSPPEIFSSSEYSGDAVDVWSMGMVCLEVLSGPRSVESAISRAPLPEPEQAASSEGIRFAFLMKEYFEQQNVVDRYLQEHCRYELTRVKNLLLPTISDMLRVEAARRIRASEVRAVILQNLEGLAVPVVPSSDGPRRPAPFRRAPARCEHALE